MTYILYFGNPTIVAPVAGLPPLVTGTWRPRLVARTAEPVKGTYRPEAP